MTDRSRRRGARKPLDVPAALTLLLALAASSGLAAGTVAHARETGGKGERPDLTGWWTLDAARSDDPRRELASGRRGPGGFGERGGGGRGGRGGGGWGRRGGGGPPGDGGGPEGGPRRDDGGGGPPGGAFGPRGGRPDSTRMARVMHPAVTMEIRETDTDVVIVERNRDPRHVLIVDQKPEEKVAPDVFYVDGKKFVEVSPLGPRRRLRETYELSKDGRTLTIVSHMEGTDGRGRTVEIKRVYRKAEAAPPPSEKGAKR